MTEEIKIVKYFSECSKDYGWSRSKLDVAFYNSIGGIRVKEDKDNFLGNEASLDTITQNQIKKLDNEKEFNNQDTSGDTSFHQYIEKTITHFEEFDDLIKLVSKRKIEKKQLMRLINNGYSKKFLSGLYNELKT